MIGLPHESLHAGQLAALADWLPRTPESHHTPDVFISCLGRLHDEVRTALANVPLVEETEAERRFQFGRGASPNEPPTFAFLPPYVGGHFIRGTPAATIVSFNNGKSSLALPAPPSFDIRTFARVRLVFRNLPLPLPVTPSTAQLVHPNAIARDGVLLLTNAQSDEWNFDIRLPTAGQALQNWVTDKGFALTRTQDGRDADALLRRLGGLDALDVLADPKRLSLLRALAPSSRVKLAQRLIAEAERADKQLDEATVTEWLADLGLFLEIEARTADDIASRMGAGTSKHEVFNLLAPLVEAGFVRRSKLMRCPQCRFRSMLDLRELDETVRCRACGESLTLPVVDESGNREPANLYRLDGLTARVMDQDILPVLLTLRAVRPAPQQADQFFAWPGVELAKSNGNPVDIDLLVSNGTTVWCYEVKNNATGLKSTQLRRLIDLASEIDARPGIAALEGEFSQELSQKVAEANGRVLTANDLLT
ncbi:MAG TPA: hypothetical protein VK790_02420 [Solirubrobacteraceae bacterium]|nr:hypothetical protein [Solirubrobacteraceae bacterium]